MDPVEEILRFHRPLDDATFKAEVKALRERSKDPEWLYEAVEGDLDDIKRQLWQGDILPSVGLPFVNSDGGVELVEGPAMLLSTTCDAVPGQDPSAVLAPVYPLEEFTALMEGADRKRSNEANLRANTFARYMFLPAWRNFRESYVSFAESAAVSTLYLERLRRQTSVEDRVRFSRLGWYFFNYKLGYFYARAEDESEVARRREKAPGWAW